MYPKLFRDYETRSTVDLKKVGAHVYAAHPSTQLLVAVWIIEWSKGECSEPIIWRRGGELPEEIRAVRELIEASASVVGHNAAFEAAIDNYCLWCRPAYWPIPKLEQLDCTMARAAVQALPLDLDGLCRALDLPVQKDREGHRLMLQMCKPRKARKDEPDGVYWFDDADRMERLTRYCITDVRAEIEADRVLAPLQEQERPVWLLDQVMNNRGVQIDREFVDCAEALVARAMQRADARMLDLTGGFVRKVTEIARLKNFAKVHGVAFSTMDKTRRSGEKYEAEVSDREALEDLLDGTLPEPVRKAFEIRLDAGKSSLKKLARFKWQAPYERARGNLQYHAAGPGRWAGRGIQLQNLVRRGINEAGGWNQAYHDMRTMSDDTFEMAWGSPFAVVSRMMRGAIIAAPGHQLYFADFANVEARGCVWAAGQDDMLKLFRNDGMIYEEMGAAIFGMSAEEVSDLHKTKKDIVPRFVGKETVLGCGYGMGWKAFKRNCKKKGGIVLPDDVCEKAVYGWRDRNAKVVKLWEQLEDAAVWALRHPGLVSRAGPFRYRREGPWLQCRLPSERVIWYRQPRLRPNNRDLETYAPEPVPDWRWKLHYWGVNGVTKQWEEESTWGGKLLENCVSHNTKILTPQGWKSIINLSPHELVFDGIDWVSHGGVVERQRACTIEIDGVRMTPDHEVLTTNGWVRAAYTEGLYRTAIWLPDGHTRCRHDRKASIMGSALRLREYCRTAWKRTGAPAVMRMLSDHASAKDPRHVLSSSLCGMALDDRSLPIANPSILEKLWSTGHQGRRPSMGEKVRSILGGYGADLYAWTHTGASEQWKGIFQGELLLGHIHRTSAQHSTQHFDRNPMGAHDNNGSSDQSRHRDYNTSQSNQKRVAFGPLVRRILFPEPVFDILNCGPRQRFVVLGDSGPFIVHNCIQGMCADFLRHALLGLEAAHYWPVLSVHDEPISEVEMGFGSVEEYVRIVSAVPSWAAGFPLRATGGCGIRYAKA